MLGICKPSALCHRPQQRGGSHAAQCAGLRLQMRCRPRPTRYLVCVQREDLFFGETQLEDERNEGFGNLAPPCRLGREKKVSGKLLSDRAAALQSMGLVTIRNPCPGDSERGHPVMAEERLVFAGRHGIHEHFRYVLEFHQAAFRTRRIGKIRNELWRSSVNFRRGRENLRAQLEINSLRITVRSFSAFLQPSRPNPLGSLRHSERDVPFLHAGL